MSATLVTGATGLIGRTLVENLRADGRPIHALVRDTARTSGLQGVRLFRWDGERDAVPADALEGVDAVVHLAGESISRRWTSARKERIRQSRVRGTRSLVEALVAAPSGPRVLVSGSAVGFYGDRGDEPLTEGSPPGQGFLAGLCQEWEAEALRAAQAGIRVVLLRTAVVLARDGGALSRMLPPFRLGLGGPLGSGRQWFPWIHLHDQVALIRHLLARDDLAGPINAVAPEEATNRDFVKALGAALHRPAALPAPAFALRLGLGEMAREMLLASQRVKPERALGSGFGFRHPSLRPALADVLG